MQVALMLVLCWALAFVTLLAALLLLNVYYSVIGNDLALGTLRQEILLAAAASLIEGASAWVVVSFIPGAARAMIVPALVVAILDKCAHLDDWNRYDLFFLLLFQAVIATSGGCLFFGHFQAATVIVAFFAGFLVILGSLIRSK